MCRAGSASGGYRLGSSAGCPVIVLLSALLLLGSLALWLWLAYRCCVALAAALDARRWESVCLYALGFLALARLGAAGAAGIVLAGGPS